MEAIGEFVADIGLGRIEPFHASLGLGIVTFDIDQNLRGTAILGELHASHTDQSDTRIAELAFD